MASETSIHLKMPFIMPSQAQAGITHNEALIRLDGCVQLSVIDRGHDAPPSSPAEGDRYLVAASPSGAFAGHEDEIAYFADGAWVFLAPREGWQCWVDDEARLVIRHADMWQVLAGEGAELVSLLGINTAADTTNRLIVRSDAALFTHDGEGCQLKINKADTTDTASLLFQNDFGGRAEIGLVGDDDFVFKVSDDGSTFVEAIRIDAASGAVFVNSRQPTVQTLTASGSWVRPDGCRTVVIEAVGGGGGGGGADGQGSGRYGAAGGGGAGASGKTAPVDVSAITYATVTIGAAGAGASAGGGNGTAGGDTIWADGANSFTWGGGAGGEGVTATTEPRCRRGGVGGLTVNLPGGGGNGDTGQASTLDSLGGSGGSGAFGRGGGAVQSISGAPVNGSGASGYGAGGGGGAAHETASNASGGDGGAGFMRVWEFY